MRLDLQVPNFVTGISQVVISLFGIGLDAVTLAAATTHRLLRPEDVDAVCAQEHRNGQGLVAGLIAHRSVSVLVGDSGLGKSPLAYQLGLCVASGIPFLGMKTEQGTVVYADYENGLEDSKELRGRIVQFLGLQEAPDNFLLWSPEHADYLNLEAICRDLKPSLLVVDSLRAHDPSFEKNDNAGQGMKALRSVAYKFGAAILAIHHIKKPGPDGIQPLDHDDTRLMQWLNLASGHRSIVNQSDTRIAGDASRRVPDAAMVLRWHRRLRSEAGPIYVQRTANDEGEPIGYSVMRGVNLLSNAEQAEAFAKLPERFTFKQAKAIYGRTDDPTKKWLNKCEAFGLAQQVDRGLYEKTNLRE